MKKLICSILLLLSFISFALADIYTQDYNNFLTYSIADLRYCRQGGDCVLNNLSVNNFTTINIVSLNMTGNITAMWGTFDNITIGGTNIFSLFFPLSGKVGNTTAEIMGVCNASGYIINWNSSGMIQNWNSTGLIQEWNTIIPNYTTNGSILYQWNKTGNTSTEIYNVCNNQSFIKSENGSVIYIYNSSLWNYTSDEIYINKINQNFTLNVSKINETILDKIASASTTYYPNSTHVVGGTNTTGNITLMWYYDSLTYNITEGNGGNPLDFYINFTNVSNFNQIVLREYYLGSSSHTISVSLWDYNLNTWESYFSFVGQSGQTVLTVPVFDSSDHKNNGVVQLYLHHIQNGISSHVLYIDFAWLLQGTVASSTNLEGYARYNFGYNNFNGNGNFTTTDHITAGFLSGLLNWSNLTNVPRLGNTSSEIFGVCSNNSFILSSNGSVIYLYNTSWINQSGQIQEWNMIIPNYTTNGSIIYDWNTSWINQSGQIFNWSTLISSSGGGNTTDEIFAVCNNETFLKNENGSVIYDWNTSWINNTGLILNWSSELNSTGLIQNYSVSGTTYYSDEKYINKNASNTFVMNETKLNSTIQEKINESMGSGQKTVMYFLADQFCIGSPP